MTDSVGKPSPLSFLGSPALDAEASIEQRRIRLIDAVATASPAASGELYAFRIERAEPEWEEIELYALAPVAGERAQGLRAFANAAWAEIGGDIDPNAAQRALSWAAAAAWRAALVSVINNACLEAYPSLARLEETADWTDADAIARQWVVGHQDKAVVSFTSWCSRYEPADMYHPAGKAPPEELGEFELNFLPAALAVLWIDEAARPGTTDLRAFELIGQAGSLMHKAGLYLGWLALSDRQQFEARRSGRRGAARRREATNALKSWAVSAAAAVRGSDVEVARRLVQVLPEHLRDVSEDPEQLIYKALRARKKAAGRRTT